MTVAEYAAHWTLRHARRVSRRSMVVYRVYLDKHILPRLGHIALAALRVADVARFVDGMLEDEYAGSTVRAAFWQLHGILDLACREELLITNPAIKSLLEDVPLGGKREPIADHELKRLLPAFHQIGPVGLFMLFLLETGVRIGEGLGLLWRDVNLEERRARITGSWNRGVRGPTKSRQERVVELTDAAVQLLRIRVGIHPEWVWTSTMMHDRPWEPNSVQKAFQHAMELAGLSGDYTPHALRHTYATQLVEAGVDLRWLQQQLGHANLGITSDLYARRARRARPGVLDQWSRERHVNLALIPGGGGGPSQDSSQADRAVR